MRFVNHHEIVVGPIEGFQINVATHATVTRQIRVIEHVIVEPVIRKNIAGIVASVHGPIITQAFWCKHEYPVIAQLIVFDYCQRFERFTQAHAVCDDATLVLFQLADCSYYAVFLKII